MASSLSYRVHHNGHRKNEASTLIGGCSKLVALNRQAPSGMDHSMDRKRLSTWSELSPSQAATWPDASLTGKGIEAGTPFSDPHGSCLLRDPFSSYMLHCAYNRSGPSANSGTEF